MSIAKRANGAYTVRIDGDPIKGRRTKITIGTFPTKKEADRAERDALQNKDRGIDLNPERIDVATLLDRYMQDRTDRGRGAKTVERYGELAALYLKPHIGTVAVAKLKPAHVTELLALLRKQGGAKGRPLSPGSVRHAFVLLNGALGWALRNELVSRNVTKAIEPPSIPRTVAVALSDNEARVILAAAERTRWGPFMRLAIICGARRGELVGLRWGDIDFPGGTLTVACSLSQTRAHGMREKSTKTDRVRTLDDLSPEALEALHRQRAAQNAERLAAGERYRDSGHVFQEPLGGPVAPDKATGAFRPLPAAAAWRRPRCTRSGTRLVPGLLRMERIPGRLRICSVTLLRPSPWRFTATSCPESRRRLCSGKTSGSPLWRVPEVPTGHQRATAVPLERENCLFHRLFLGISSDF